MPSTPYGTITLLTELSKEEDVVFAIEKVHSMPKQGVASTFTFGMNYGMLLGIIMTLDKPIEHINPAEWEKHFKISGKHNAKESRDKSIMVLNDKCPETRYIKYHSGIFDAILIALFNSERNANDNSRKEYAENNNRTNKNTGSFS